MPNGETVSVPQAAALCGVSRSTINNWIRAKRLFAKRSGKIYSVHTTDLLLLLESMGKAIPPELRDTNPYRPVFRSFRHCWERRNGHNHGQSCKDCVVLTQELDICFTAAKGSQLKCPEPCHACGHYQEIFRPRIQFILQMKTAAAVCRGLYFLGANQPWAQMCQLPWEDFIGMDVETVIHPNSLAHMLSILKGRELGEEAHFSSKISLRDKKGKRRIADISVFPVHEPPRSSLILATLENGSGEA
ncbi:MAG: helix-turn-helix domain-containing protein [Desulfatiglandaceae bacterium]